ncbi:LEAF RUST 10 DISEASE-RESISTANCE LOCUS RECEPTOR-LIKE PROTEIN KINASE-like 1.2, partial [Mucuna pruriens]
MNPKPLLLLLSVLPTITLSLDPRFEACEPKTCGNGQNISYPFYIQEKQKSYCGNPGFEIKCGPNGFPILNLINTDYTIQKIFYNNHSLRVSNPAFSQPNASSCVAPAQNLTIGKYRFRFAPNQRDLFLFYGCDLAALPKRLQERRVGCSAGNETTSVVGLDRESQDLGLARGNCTGGAVTATVEDARGGVGEALRKGFLLIWNATNCTECNLSGGRCGFDPDPLTYAFRCYCPDRPHVVKCDSVFGIVSLRLKFNSTMFKCNCTSHVRPQKDFYRTYTASRDFDRYYGWTLPSLMCL